ncbi:MAG: agmatine deiminase family protein [bacterium]|nr:agmatine deiminase family protein [bacterium]
MDLRITINRIFMLTFGFLMLVNVSCTKPKARDTASTRLPGEWEEQASVWMQWPGDWESGLRPSFVSIAAVIQQYENVNLIVLNESMKSRATQMFREQNVPLTRITFHTANYDSIWLRDNGPVYVFDKNSKWVQDFGFDAYGQDSGDDVEYKNDNKIPQVICHRVGGEYENNNSYILERGNLEANGKDMVMLNWDCQRDRNPGWSKERTEIYLKEKFGVSRVIWMEGHDPEDITTGHIDGTARFVNESTVVIARVADAANESYSGEKANLDNLAAAAKAAGLTVERFPIPGFISVKGEELPAIYMNYLVGNKFVLGMAFGNDAWDKSARAKLQSLYPNRTVHMIEVNAIWRLGGGIHCVTNDEPLHSIEYLDGE